MSAPCIPDVEDIGLGLVEHNLTCWICRERPAIHHSEPHSEHVWFFTPCEVCVPPRIRNPWWKFWLAPGWHWNHPRIWTGTA